MSLIGNSPLEPLNVAVLLGGESSEREISLKSGASVVRALTERGHNAMPVDPAEVDLARHDWAGIDVAFIALHGRFGEDGQVQRILEDLEVPYTGSGVQASRLAYSKSASKERFLQHHVPTAPYVLIHESDSAARILHHASSLGFPLVVKPDTQGSSLGVSIVRSPDELPAALTRCFHLDAFGILESCIVGEEWTVGLVYEDVLPLIQIETNRAFFDYQAKYKDDQTVYRFDFEATAEVIERITRSALDACLALETKGLVRVDVMLDKFQRPWVLEVNTVPGLTDHSLVPKAAARAGLTLGELCEHTLRTCLETVRERRQRWQKTTN
ncbi:MAG: D-alanine--D-alanine ligase [Planctomycetales bacterium]|nr:D-alanine--D-alanine ligase [Planctomycetales bacterium]